jgi:hypothetical protein
MTLRVKRKGDHGLAVDWKRFRLGCNIIAKLRNSLPMVFKW